MQRLKKIVGRPEHVGKIRVGLGTVCALCKEPIWLSQGHLEFLMKRPGTVVVTREYGNGTRQASMWDATYGPGFKDGHVWTLATSFVR